MYKSRSYGDAAAVTVTCDGTKRVSEFGCEGRFLVIEMQQHLIKTVFNKEWHLGVDKLPEHGEEDQVCTLYPHGMGVHPGKLCSHSTPRS